ncbi:protein of unknown function [Polaromonas sp. YR568]|uniref:DUF4224 domain-containing protein n=1 Tax=Polaromonas sp. YR568 TaxID=1855301 RepID=UPI0008E42B55|nr:protein of unknown function [Polaromonas sp. YR568]
MTEYLDTEELHRLTGAARVGQQARWLSEHEIPHKLDRARLIVSREHVRAWLEGRHIPISNSPNWRALDNA